MVSKKRKRCEKQSHTRSKKKKKDTEKKTVKQKIKKGKEFIREYVQEMHTIRLQSFLFINWIFETQTLEETFEIKQQDLVQIQKLFIKDRYDCTTIYSNWFQEYKQIFTPIQISFQPLEKSLSYQARKMLTNIQEHLRIDDNIRHYTQRINTHLWKLLHLFYKNKLQFPLNEREQYCFDELMPYKVCAAYFRMMNFSCIKCKIEYLKQLQFISKDKFKNIKLCPRSDFIPGAVYFPLEILNSKVLKEYKFENAFISDGYSFCETTEKSEKIQLYTLENIKFNPRDFDNVYGCDPGVKIPVVMVNPYTKSHFNSIPEFLYEKDKQTKIDNEYIIHQQEWKKKMGGLDYIDFYLKMQTKNKMQLITTELSEANTFVEYLNVVNLHFNGIMSHYNHPNFRQWRFRKYGQKQRCLAMVVQHLTQRAHKKEDVLLDSNKSACTSEYKNDQNILNKAKKRQKWLKKNKTKEKSVLVYWGNGTFGTTYRNNEASSCHQIREYIQKLNHKNLKIQIVDEKNTSSHCCKCEQKFIDSKQTNTSWHHYRLRMCTHCLNNNQAPFYERDYGSAIYIGRRGVSTYETLFSFGNNQAVF
jgi:hypothetical protein